MDNERTTVEQMIPEQPIPEQPGYGESVIAEHLKDEKKRKRRRAGFIAAIVCCSFIAVSTIGITAVFTVSKVLPLFRNDTVTLTNGSGHPKVVTTSAETGEQLSLADISAKVGPAVVSITANALQTNPYGGNSASQGGGSGSGIILTNDGYILTNNHVISGMENPSVKLSTGKKYAAKIVGADEQTDLAILKIDATDLPFATLGDSSKLQVGDMAVAIGNPLGELTGTVTTGIISATDREITIGGEKMNLLQTDAAVNPGNSGGALVNAYGEVVGVVNAKTSALGVEGLGFAIPINDAKSVVKELIENGRVTGRAALGVSLQEVTGDTAGFFNMSPGVYAAEVTQGGAAAKAGLLPGDRIVSADGTIIGSVADVKEVVEKHTVGDELKITVDREGSEKSLTVKLQEAKE
ncbi:MAG: trypsin-like peptidase domain-containing protein [Clostridiales Family XIII bacterium]|jgi:serine protease Do|nr:trypsin-like peptidase domain-containing protein [Clostridiales Family XIII bacterium]